MNRSCCAFLIVAFLAAASMLRAQNIARPYPFTIGSRDTSALPLFAQLSTEVAGAHGALGLSADGHIVAADNTRLKFFGTSLLGTASFLSSGDAHIVALRLRALGFNCVHFAFNDITNFDDGSFFKYRDAGNQINKSSYVVNPIQLAKFDTLFAELKQNGIYTDFSLMSSHRYLSGDGLMYIDSLYSNGALAPLLDPAAAHLEREWARTLLSHRNPITGLRYADDPAFAIIEYNYEHSLYYYWNSLDRLIYIDANNYGKGKNTISWNYSRRLDTLYAGYLLKKYTNDQNLKNAWGGNIVVSNTELLANGSFEDVFSTAWSLGNRGNAKAIVTTGDGGVDSLIFSKIRISSLAPNPVLGDVNYANVSARLGKDTLYTVSYWAKMNYDGAVSPGKVSRMINVSLTSLAAGSRGGASQAQRIDTSWKHYSFTFRSQTSGLHTLSFQCGTELGDVWLDAVSVKMQAETPLGANEHLATSTVLRLHNDGNLRANPLQRVRDQIMFYDAIEQSFFASMDGLIKDTLHFQGLVNHRQHNSWQQLPDVYTASGADVMIDHLGNDFLGSRPGKTYSDSTWMIRNTSMARNKGGSIFPFAAAGSVHSKAFVLGDFQIPWPNAYNSEQMLLVPAWGAYQDWDGIFFGPYAAARTDLFADSLSNPFHTPGSASSTFIFTSIVNNPATLSLVPIASKLFRDGLVSAAEYSDSIIHDADDVWLSPVFTPSHGIFGSEGPLDNNAFTQFKLRQSFNSARHKLGAEYPYLPDTAAKRSDTRELYWDETNGLFTIHTPTLIGVSGQFGRDTTFVGTLRFARIDPAASSEQLSMYLMSRNSEPLDTTSDMLLAISTRAQNSGISWVDSNGFGTNFGTAPTVLSAATVSLDFTTTKDTLILTPLDEHGAEMSDEIRTTVRNPGLPSIKLILDQQQMKTPWYRIELKDGEKLGTTSLAASLPIASLSIFPNPASVSSTAKLTLDRASHVRLQIVDALGVVRDNIFDGQCNDRTLTLPLDLHSLSPGLYFMTASLPEGVLTQRFLKLR